MRRRLFLAATLALAACGGDDGGGGTQPQTEEAAIVATVKGLEGTLKNNPGDVLDFLNEECRASVDDEEVRQTLLFAQVLFSSDEFDISGIELTGTATEFTGDAATIAIEFEGPQGADLGLLELGNDEVDVIYENGKWVGEDCDFEDTSENEAEQLDEELDALGIAGTQDDPVPSGVAVPVGSGFTVMATDFVVDAFDLITEEGGGVEPFIDEGEQISLLALDVGYTGSEEPKSLGQLDIQLVDSSGVAVNQTSCGNMSGQVYFGGQELFSGAATSVVSCFVAPPSSYPDTPVLSIGAVFGGRTLFFSPTTSGATTDSITGTAGPSPDGDLTDERSAPNALGTAVDIDQGWTMTVNGSESDVQPTGDFDNRPPAGSSYVLVDVTLVYDGDEPSTGAFQVDLGIVGDSNLGTSTGCSLNDIPDRLDTFADVFAGGTITGNVCFTVPSADLDSLVLYGTAESFGDDREFFAIR